ncbi:MAG: recombinase family protein [Deltaproteobacteria bacterium]|nr:recombinase family protein [Deltaproteobacteria bacterium]
MKRAIGYIRVSSQEQAREGISLEMQAAKVRVYCELNDLTLVEIIEDAGISAKSIKGRPGIQSILEMVNARQIDAVVVFKLDRLARNTVECLRMAEVMDKTGVALHSITEKLDTQSALGRFFFTLTASLAEMERNLIAERTAAALAQKRANGEKTGGLCPYGFRSVNGKLEPDPAEQGVIHRMRGLRAQGVSYRGIADKLTEEGTMTRKATRFRETQIIRILREAA